MRGKTVSVGFYGVSFPGQIADLQFQPSHAPVVDSAGNTRAVDAAGNPLASQADVQSIQNNTSCVRSVPTMIERPDSATATYRIELLLYDDRGQMATPDAAPTISLVNQAGADLSARLDNVAMTLVSVGRYRAVYSASNTDAIEQLVWTFSVVVGGATRLYTNTTQVVDTTAVDFTSDDRSKLTAVYGKLPAAVPLQDGDGAFKVVDKQSGADLATAAALGRAGQRPYGGGRRGGLGRGHRHADGGGTSGLGRRPPGPRRLPCGSRRNPLLVGHRNSGRHQ